MSGSGAPCELGVGDDAGQIGAGVGPAVGGELGEVADEVEHHLEHGVVLAGAADVGILGAEELLGQLEHLGVVVLGQTEDRQDHLQRVVHRDVAGEVAASVHRGHLVHVLAGELVDPRLHLLDVARLEPVVDEVPVLLVLLAVHLHEALHRRRVLRVAFEVGFRRRAPVSARS